MTAGKADWKHADRYQVTKAWSANGGVHEKFEYYYKWEDVEAMLRKTDLMVRVIAQVGTHWYEIPSKLWMA